MALPSLPIDTIVNYYKTTMNWLHSGTARDVIVYCDPIKTGCPNHIGYDFVNKRAGSSYNSANPYPTGSASVMSGAGISGILNIPFTSGNICPVCRGEGFLITPASGTVKARVQWKARENIADFKGDSLTVFDADVRLKVLPEDASLMNRATQAKIDGKLFKVKGLPDSVGLRDVAMLYYYFDAAI